MLLYRFGSLATGRDLHSNRNGLCLQDLQLVVWSNRYRKSMRKAVGVFLMCCSWLEHRANNTKAAYSLQNWTWLFLWVSIFYNKLRDKSIWANSEVSGVAAEPCRPYLSDDHLSPGPAQPAVTAVVSSVTGQRRAGLGNGARGGCPESVSKEGVQSHSQGRCPTAHAQGGCPDPIPKQGVPGWQQEGMARKARAGDHQLSVSPVWGWPPVLPRSQAPHRTPEQSWSPSSLYKTVHGYMDQLLLQRFLFWPFPANKSLSGGFTAALLGRRGWAPSPCTAALPGAVCAGSVSSSPAQTSPRIEESPDTQTAWTAWWSHSSSAAGLAFPVFMWGTPRYTLHLHLPPG